MLETFIANDKSFGEAKKREVKLEPCYTNQPQICKTISYPENINSLNLYQFD